MARSARMFRPTNTLPSTEFARQLVHTLGQFIPGYNIILEVIRNYLGLDGDKVLAVLGFFFGGWAMINYVKNAVIPKVLNSFTSKLVIENDDKVYEDLNKWLYKKKVYEWSTVIRLVDNKTTHSTSPADAFLVSRWGGRQFKSKRDTTQLDVELVHQKASDNDVIFNSAAADALKPLRFEADAGTRCFFHRGKLFLFQRKSMRSSVQLAIVSQNITLICLGLSTQPLRDLVEEARAESRKSRAVYTNIYRPSGMMQEGGDWRKLSSRLSRAMNTITLNPNQKAMLVKDANDFLRPGRSQWYASRGIPYRRGYLLSGPPGTGKSSVSYALAGLFGLDIFIASLGKGSISDDQLSGLLINLPSKCIVLLEDVDCAGMDRKDDDEPASVASLHNLRAGVHGRSRARSGITLSGLLNAIDGVAAHEGHILIMTTNHPSALDSALKRPGRVDLHLQFKLASRPEIREIFIRMYSNPSSSPTSSSHPQTKATTTIDDVCRESSDLLIERHCPFMTTEELREAASGFAGEFEDGTVSPAEVQGYLLMYKDKPVEAIERVAEWIEAQKKSKVLQAEEAKVKAEKVEVGLKKMLDMEKEAEAEVARKVGRREAEERRTVVVAPTVASDAIVGALGARGE